MSGEESAHEVDDSGAVAYMPDRHENPWVITLKYLVKWVLLVFAGLVLAFLVFVLPGLGCGGCNGPHVTAIRDGKQWGYALFNFENDYGMYPNEESAEKLREEFPDQAHLLKTETSNDYLRQLVIAGYIDGDIAKDLDSEDFPFAYVVGLNSSVDSAVPLLISPFETGKRAFDKKYARKHYHKRTVVLHIDMSVSDPKPSDGFFDWSKYDFGELKPRIAWPKR